MREFSDIYPKYKDFVFRICSRYARSLDDAEDLTQETFVKALGRFGDFRGGSLVSTWLYRVAVNGCLDYLRRLRREEKNLEAFLDDMVVRNLAPEGDRVLARLELNRILGRIRPAVRKTLFLTLAEGLSYAEAAEVLGVSPSAVAKTVLRFLAKRRSKDLTPVPGPDKAMSRMALSAASKEDEDHV